MKKNLSRTFTTLGCLIWVTFALCSTVTFAAAPGGSTNLWGSYSTTASKDITKPTPDRSYFTTSVAPIPGGAHLTVEIYQGKLMSPVSLWIQVAINDGLGNVKAIPIIQLNDRVKDNPTVYYSKREFDLSYAELNAALQKVLPANAKGLEIGPGSPLFVAADFPDFSHYWGGIGAGGIFTMPEESANAAPGAAAPTVAAAARRPEELDLAIPITGPMTMKFNDSATGEGLKDGGQIRSRMETEGKYMVALSDAPRVKKALFDIANDPAKQAKILGPDWTLTAMLKYAMKDAAGNMLKGPDGLPIPDPMIDTQLDNDTFGLAKHDATLRYRMTEGNGVGEYNYKPGMGVVDKDGIVTRIEDGLDTTSNKPEILAKYADSEDPLNIFGSIRKLIPGATPSDFLKKASLKETDTRYKFTVQHKSGLKFELSLDNVVAVSMRGHAGEAKFAQMEMDVEHLSTQSMNVATAPSRAARAESIGPTEQTFLNGLNKDAFLDGRPVMHTTEDLEPNSPVRMKHATDLELAHVATVAIRDEILGPNWVQGAQKNSLSATLLGLIKESEASQYTRDAVKFIREDEAKMAAAAKTAAPEAKPAAGAVLCGNMFN